MLSRGIPLWGKTEIREPIAHAHPRESNRRPEPMPVFLDSITPMPVGYPCKRAGKVHGGTSSPSNKKLKEWSPNSLILNKITRAWHNRCLSAFYIYFQALQCCWMPLPPFCSSVSIWPDLNFLLFEMFWKQAKCLFAFMFPYESPFQVLQFGMLLTTTFLSVTLFPNEWTSQIAAVWNRCWQPSFLLQYKLTSQISMVWDIVDSHRTCYSVSIWINL